MGNFINLPQSKVIMAEWNTYIEQITSKYDFETNAVTLGNVCDAAAIYGNDGSCWAYSANFPELTSYQFVVEGMTESENQTVDVNEVDAATKVANGDRKPSGAAGIRLGNAKYMFIAHDETAKARKAGKSPKKGTEGGKDEKESGLASPTSIS